MFFLVANWKMKLNKNDVETWKNRFAFEDFEDQHDLNIIISPSYIHIPLLEHIPVNLCAQDISIQDKGSHTGEVGGFQLTEYCRYAIVGHSERGESTEIKLQKATKCIENHIIPIICFSDFKEMPSLIAEDVLLAWEDPINISNDGVYNPKSSKEVIKKIKQLRTDMPENLNLLYGGSVNKDNAKQLSEIPGINGFLVGHASCDADHFYEICELVTK